MGFGGNILEFFHPFSENTRFAYQRHTLFVMYILHLVKIGALRAIFPQRRMSRENALNLAQAFCLK
jgi:hypothetical protein